jgi:hypothetical protein
MEAVSSSKMANFYEATLYHSPEEIVFFSYMVCTSFFSDNGNLEPKCVETSAVMYKTGIFQSH